MIVSYSVVLIAFILFSGVNSATPAQDPTPYKFMLDEYSKHVELGCGEKLMGLDYGITYNPWIYDSLSTEMIALPRWQDDYFVTYDVVLSQYYSEVLSGIYPMTNQQSACLLKALEIMENTTSPQFESSIQVTDWYANFANGEYNKTINFTTSFEYENETANATIWSTTLARVDVRPAGWFVQSVLWLSRNSILKNDMCGDDTSVQSCLFDPNTGEFNAIITGFVVVSGCERHEYFKDGNSSIVCQLDIPYIVAWVVQELPQRDDWC